MTLPMALWFCNFGERPLEKKQPEVLCWKQGKWMPDVTPLKAAELHQGWLIPGETSRYVGRHPWVCLYQRPGGLWKEKGNKQIYSLWAELGLAVTLIQQFAKCSLFQAGDFSSPVSHADCEDCPVTTAGCSPPACRVCAVPPASVPLPLQPKAMLSAGSQMLPQQVRNSFSTFRFINISPYKTQNNNWEIKGSINTHSL